MADYVQCHAARCDEPATLAVDIRNRRGRGSDLPYCDDHAAVVMDSFNAREGMTALAWPLHSGSINPRSRVD